MPFGFQSVNFEDDAPAHLACAQSLKHLVHLIKSARLDGGLDLSGGGESQCLLEIRPGADKRASDGQAAKDRV